MPPDGYPALQYLQSVRVRKKERQLSHAFAALLRTLAPVVGWDFLEQTALGTGAATQIRPLRPRTNDWDRQWE